MPAPKRRMVAARALFSVSIRRRGGAAAGSNVEASPGFK